MSALSADELAFLQAHSGATPNPQALAEARIANAVNEENELSDALTVREVADLLGVSPSRVRHWLADGSLYAYKSQGRGTERKLPRWQFHHGDVIPHLGEVLNALPDNDAPLGVKAFFLNARVEHPTSEENYSVRDWLLGGQDPAEAIALADEQKYTL